MNDAMNANSVIPAFIFFLILFVILEIIILILNIKKRRGKRVKK